MLALQFLNEVNYRIPHPVVYAGEKRQDNKQSDVYGDQPRHHPIKKLCTI